MRTQIISCLLCCCFLFACDTSATEDLQRPEVFLQSPLANATFSNGEQIPVQVSIFENVELHTYHLTISTPGNGEVKFEIEKHKHTTEVLIDEIFVPEVKLDTDFLIRIEAEDHNGNSTIGESSFQVKF